MSSRYIDDETNRYPNINEVGDTGEEAERVFRQRRQHTFKKDPFFDDHIYDAALAKAQAFGISEMDFNFHFKNHLNTISYKTEQSSLKSLTPSEYLTRYISKINAAYGEDIPSAERNSYERKRDEIVSRLSEQFFHTYKARDEKIYKILKDSSGRLEDPELKKEFEEALEHRYSMTFDTNLAAAIRQEAKKHPELWFSQDALFKNIKKETDRQFYSWRKENRHVFETVKNLIRRIEGERVERNAKPRPWFGLGVIQNQIDNYLELNELDKSFSKDLLKPFQVIGDSSSIYVEQSLSKIDPKKNSLEDLMKGFVDNLHNAKQQYKPDSEQFKSAVQTAQQIFTYRLWAVLNYERDIETTYKISEELEKTFKLGEFKNPRKEGFASKHESLIATGLMGVGAGLAFGSKEEYKDERDRTRAKIGFWGKVGVGLCVVGGLLLADRAMGKPMMGLLEQVGAKAVQTFKRL